MRATIIQRQTTYWVLRTADDGAWRVHFTDKAETRFTGAHCESLALLERHPVLDDHNASSSSLFVSSAADDPGAIVEALAADVLVATDGWRALAAYGAPAVLVHGYGLFMKGPQHLVERATGVLDRHGVVYSVLSTAAPEVRCRLLLMGASFVVARAFRFEPLPGA